MGKLFNFIVIIAILVVGVSTFYYFVIFRPGKEKAGPGSSPTSETQKADQKVILLPEPKLKGEMSLEETILKRRSRRDYQDKSLNLEQVSQILWAGQGITNEETGFRSAPSAGALYPLDIYLVVGEKGVEGLVAGVYHFVPSGHKIEKMLSGDLRERIMRASLAQSFIAQAPIVLIITGEYERTTKKYGERGEQYVHMEVGHVGQNIYLQAEALGLATVTVGAFNEEEIVEILNLPQTYKPLYVMPIGYPR